MRRDVQDLTTQSAVILANVHAKSPISSLEDSTATQILLNTNMILRNLQHLSLGSGDTESNGRLHLIPPQTSEHSQRFKDFEHSYVEFTNHPPDISVGCTCHTINKAYRWQALSNLYFTRTFRSQHFSFCPRYQNSEQSLEFKVHMVPPSWLLSCTINLGIQVKNWWTFKPLSISPIVIGTSRVVDSRTSPGFRAIMDAKRAVYCTGQHHIYIPKLQHTLRDLFDQQKASSLDIDSNGRTLLNVRVRFLSSKYRHTDFYTRNFFGFMQTSLTRVYQKDQVMNMYLWSNSCWIGELIQI